MQLVLLLDKGQQLRVLGGKLPQQPPDGARPGVNALSYEKLEVQDCWQYCSRLKTAESHSPASSKCSAFLSKASALRLTTSASPSGKPIRHLSVRCPKSLSL